MPVMQEAPALKTAPGPGRTLPLFNLIAFRRDPLAWLQRVSRTYGDVARYRMPGRTVFFLSDPEYIKDLLITSSRKFHKSLVLERSKRLLGEGLLTSEDDFHLRQRRLAQPAFHRQRLAGYGRAMVEITARHREDWRDGQALDIHHAMMRTTLCIVGKTLFDADIESEAKDVGEAMDTFMNTFGLVFWPFSRQLEKLPFGPMGRFRDARKRLDKLVYRMIAERRASGEDRGDLLSMLLAATDIEGDGSGMTDLQLRDECVTILLAGHETTANALTWTWMLLSQNPEAEAKFHAEVDALGGRLPTVEDLSALKYTEMVLSESMRLFPPAYAVGRRAMEDHSFGEYRVPKNSMVICSQWVMHRDPRYWPEPLRFDPGRWTPEAKAARPRFAYFPFGAGPRQCIGDGFAWMEGVLLLATFAQRWKLRLVPGHKTTPLPVITLRPKYGMKMTVHRRN